MCVAHHRQRVEADLRVPGRPGVVEELGYEPPGQAPAPRLRPDKETLHLRDVALERPKPDHPHQLPVVFRHQQRAARGHVFPGQPFEFGVDLLEGEIEPDPRDVLREHVADGGDIRRLGGAQGHVFQPGAAVYSLSSVNTAGLALPMPMTGEAESSPANPEVVRLVALAKTGDRAAFGRLIEEHLAAARRLALAAVGQATDADEAVQEASVAAWTRLDALQEPAAFRGWYMRIVWRKAIDRRRSVRTWFERFGSSSSDDRPMELPAAEPAADQQLISRELATAIAQVVRALPRKLREPFLLAASGDHRYEEIAALLAIPVGTVKWRISEARKMIRAKLERLGHGPQTGPISHRRHR